MALNFKGETTTAILNNTENVYKKDDLFRLYDAGILKLGNVVCEHGDFVSWNGTSWQLEKNAGYAVETSGAGESLEERVGAIEETIPDDASANNKLATNKDLSYIKRLLTNPLNLPPKTFRCKFKSGYTPDMGISQTLVDNNNNIWDIGFEGADFLFGMNTDLLQVIGANISGITSIEVLFRGCTSLTSVALFDTSSVTSMYGTFFGCTSLASVPLFDTSSNHGFAETFFGCTSLASVPLFDTSHATDMGSTFEGCVAVTGGALALYQQASAQSAPPLSYGDAFKNCGASTTTGAAELAQIPASWGGTAAG